MIRLTFGLVTTSLLAFTKVVRKLSITSNRRLHGAIRSLPSLQNNKQSAPKRFKLTDDKHNFDEYIDRVDFAFAVRVCIESRIVWDHNCDIEANYQNEPIPASFCASIMRNYETLLLNCGSFVLR